MCVYCVYNVCITCVYTEDEESLVLCEGQTETVRCEDRRHRLVVYTAFFGRKPNESQLCAADLKGIYGKTSGLSFKTSGLILDLRSRLKINGQGCPNCVKIWYFLISIFIEFIT